jgi:lambda repressor-like predicted transcriptional regulator
MSAEMNTVVSATRGPARAPARALAPAPPGPARRRAARAPRPVVAVLADGTPAFAPVGEVVVTGARVVCHLCGRPFRSVTAHLRVHGYTKEAYCAAFGLERGQSLEGPDTRKLRAAALTSRLVFDPAFRAGSAAGRQRARSGDLTRDAAAAATGRRHPEQRRRKARRALAGIPAGVVAQANAERARRHVARVAADVARRHGYPDLGAFVTARTADGASLAAISREAGLHKDWLSRHLPDIAPAAAAVVPGQRPARADARWRPALDRLGFPDVPSYLRERHVGQRRTVNAMAAEIGVTHHAIESALRRHGLDRVAHAAARHAAGERAAQVAAGLGYHSLGGYLRERRAAGWTWRAMSAEAGQPESGLRRQAARSPEC